MVTNAKPVAILIRLPKDVKEWIEREAERNASSQNSEIVRCIRGRMASKASGLRAKRGELVRA
jgi:Arc-like DNA binding domain